MIPIDTEGDQVFEAGAVRDLLERGGGHVIYSAQATRSVRLPAPLRSRQAVLLNCTDPRGEYAGHRDAIWLVGEVRPGTHSGRSSRCLCRWSGGHPSPRPPSGGSCDCAVISPTPAASQWNSR